MSYCMLTSQNNSVVAPKQFKRWLQFIGYYCPMHIPNKFKYLTSLILFPWKARQNKHCLILSTEMEFGGDWRLWDLPYSFTWGLRILEFSVYWILLVAYLESLFDIFFVSTYKIWNLSDLSISIVLDPLWRAHASIVEQVGSIDCLMCYLDLLYFHNYWVDNIYFLHYKH